MSILPVNPSPALAASLAGGQEPPSLEFPDRFVDAAVAILDAEAPGTFKVAPMPDKVENFDIGESDGAIIVHWRGSKYQFSAGAQPVVGQSSFDVDVHVIARGVTGASGAPNIIERIRVIFQNRRVAGALPLAPVEDGFVDQKEGVWRYYIAFRGGRPAIGAQRAHEERS